MSFGVIKKMSPNRLLPPLFRKRPWKTALKGRVTKFVEYCNYFMSNYILLCVMVVLLLSLSLHLLISLFSFCSLSLSLLLLLFFSLYYFCSLSLLTFWSLSLFSFCLFSLFTFCFLVFSRNYFNQDFNFFLNGEFP